MKTIKFYEIPEHVKFLEFDEDKTDLRLHFDRSIRWWEENEQKYKEIEDTIYKYKIERKNYTVYAWCDISGFEYWIKQQEEENYIQISVMFENENFNINDLKQLENDLIETDLYFEQFKSYKSE